MKGTRLLDCLIRQFPLQSRKNLHSLILCGKVKVDDAVIRDPKFPVSGNEVFCIQEKDFVSRGAYKLLTALEAWNIDVADKIMLDAGASTGGFTDVLLRRGAARVYAVDVGYNLLDYRLRIDQRVQVMEKTNVMDVSSLDPQPHGAVADLSFRSLKGAAEHLISLTAEGWCICLIKPQFEIDPATPGFSGVISDPSVIRTVLDTTIGQLKERGLKPRRLIASAVKGTKGNQEYLVLIDQNGVFGPGYGPEMVERALNDRNDPI
ncbi:MAG: TlyA family RNA methyltransferase [Spirochaetales bacterium]|nr:TlyA family RNA methyltransferase [Spirochaetales bacterium]